MTVTVADVEKSASELFSPEGVAIWMDHPQKLGGLAGLTPREAVAQDRGSDVLALLEGLKDGVFF